VKNRQRVLYVLLAVGLAVAQLRAEDWPIWRGPSANGISAEKGWNPKALAGEPRIAWRTGVGSGYSGVSTAAGRLYTMGYEEGNDTVLCLDALTGKKLWGIQYACKKGSYAGPRATPVVDGDVVYTVSRQAHVHCLDAVTGDTRWSRNLLSETKAQDLRWGIAGSAVVLGDRLLINAGKHGTVLDKKTGKTLWASSGIGGYSTPVVYGTPGTRMALFSQKGACGVDIKTGKQLWFHPWETRYDVNAADPIVAGSKCFVSSGYGRGCAMLDIGSSRPRTLWEHKDLKNHFSSCVLYKGCLYGIDGNAGRGSLKCLDWETGRTKWSRNLGFGALMLADGKLIVINEKGYLYIAAASPDGYEEYSSGRVLQRKVCWTAPILSNGLIYCRNSHGDLVAVDMR